MSARVSLERRPTRSRSTRLTAGAPRLRERRRRSRRLFLWFVLLLLLLLLAAAVYLLWRPGVRVSAVQVFGADASFASYATDAMRGTYLGIVPRNSTFFLPTHQMRVTMIAAHPDIAALSIFRHGTTGLSIRVVERTAVGEWCGSAYVPFMASSTAADTTSCYVFDPGGFIYAPASTAPDTLNSFVLYAPLVGDTQEPLRATIAHADLLPAAANLARQLSTFGVQASALVIRDDECDIMLSSGTRVTYVLGHEEDAYSALTSAKANLNLADGSIDYVDLRFPGRVYLKKKSE